MIAKEEVLECLEDLDDFSRMAGVEPIGAYNCIKEFIEEHYQDSLRWKKCKELNLDVGIYYRSIYDTWFEYYDDESIDKIIQDENS